MYKILIVDDEPHILEGLKHVVNWEEHGIEISAQAHNGVEALEILDKNKVHILLSDIRMPKMDGLELIRRVKQKGWNIRFIILSGHDDFMYIKEAVKLGMENYLLKPVDKEELSRTLLNTIEKIESDLYKNITERQGMNVFRENILNRWVSNRIDENELLEKSPHVNIKLKGNEYTAAIVKVFPHTKASAGESENKQNLADFAVLNICSEMTQEGELAYVFNDLNGDIVLLFPGNGPGLCKQEILNVLQSCISNINICLKMDIFISVGSRENGYKTAYKSYQTAKELQGYSLIISKNSIVDMDEISKAAMERQEKTDIDFAAFSKMLDTKKTEECTSFIDACFDRMKLIKGITPQFIQNTAIEILYHISNALKNNSRNNMLNKEDLRISFSDVYQISTITELTSWLKLVVQKAVEIMKSDEDKYTPLIKQILSYIKQNYNRDISIKLLSSIFNINSAYLGQLFKNETGEMLTNYINGIRIEKARDMLLHTNLKVSDISEKVGYVNTNYFYRIFKKITGVSPAEYR